MFKKIMATAVLVCTIPAMASASWFLTTQAKSAGGYIDTVNKNGQRVIDGLMFKSYTTAGDVSYKIEADAGYAIRSVTAGGVTTTAEGAPLANPYLGTIAGSKTTDKGVTATFVADKMAVTAGIGYGSVSPSKLGNIYYNTKLIKAVTFVFTPRVGYQITAVTGVPTGITATPATPAAVNERVMVTFPAGYTFTAPVALNATVVNVTKAMAPILTKTVAVGATATMTAVPNENVTNPVYAWTYISGPKNTIVTNNVGGNVSQTVTPGPVLTVLNPTTATASFVAPADVGQYKFKVVVTADGGTTLTTYATVNVLNTQADAANQCQFCHTANGIGDPAIGSGWALSGHATNSHGPICTTCHAGAGSGGHPGLAPTNATCTGCHSGTYAPDYHVSANSCATCHNPHNLGSIEGTIATSHTGGAVAPGHAQFVSSTVTCVNCHADNANSAAIMAEFKVSAHGNPAGEAWAHYDWRSASRAACQRCHNGSAFVGKLETLGDTANFFGATPPVAAGEVLNCNACHADVTTGELRAASTAFTVSMSNGASIDYDVPGGSALCVRCHGGRESGDSVKLKVDAFTNLSFINSHYLAAGGTVYNKTGYEYAGQTYDNLGFHKNVGKDNTATTGTNGPCVACHMSAGAGHTWDFVSKDVDGVITANNSSACVKCHDSLTAADLQAAKDSVHTALTTLQTALASKGILFYNAHPYFYKDLNANGVYDAATEAGSANAFKNWDAVYPGLGKDVMGAAFNFNLIEHDPGAYAHNKQYAMKLIADSIDFLNDGVVDGDSGVVVAGSAIDGHSATLANVSLAGAINPALDEAGTAAPATANVTTATCGVCHSGVTADQLKANPYIDDIADRFATSRHANQSARAGLCSACHSHQGGITHLGMGRMTSNDALVTAYTAETTNVYLLPVGGTTVGSEGVVKKNCATCHDSNDGNVLRGEGVITSTDLGMTLPEGASTTANKMVVYSAEFNLCTTCHQVDLAVTYQKEADAGALFKYELSGAYAKANLVDATGTTWAADATAKLSYHATDNGRAIVDTHFGGTIMDNVVKGTGIGDGTDGKGTWTDMTLAGYNINAASANSCTICHDPHTSGKVLSVAVGQTDSITNTAVSFAEGLGGFHTNYLSEAQGHGCTPCHQGTEFVKLTVGGTPAGSVGVIGCRSCHDQAQPNATPGTNNAAAFDDVRSFPAGYEFKFSATAAAPLTAADLGASAICFECHKGRTAGKDVALLSDPAAGTTNYAISYLHYAPSMAILYGDDSKMVATYAGKTYSGRFAHPFAVNDKTQFTCTDCHNVHTGADVMLTSASCVGCHSDASVYSKSNLAARTQAFSERLLDEILTDVLAADGTAGLNAALQTKITELKGQDLATQKTTLMSYIQERQAYFPNKTIAHAATTWKVFTYEDGPEHGQTHGHGGSWAHNSKFARQVMFDAIESLGGDTTGLVRPTL